MLKWKMMDRYCPRLAKRELQPALGFSARRHHVYRLSSSEKYFLAAADQASGTRDERLAKVIKAKYEAGLLKPYDYSRGYAKMYKWLEKK